MKVSKLPLKIIIGSFILSLILIPGINRVVLGTNPTELDPCDIPDGVQINTFPVDLDLLFWADDLSMQNQKLNELGNGTESWMLSPLEVISSRICMG